MVEGPNRLLTQFASEFTTYIFSNEVRYSYV